MLELSKPWRDPAGYKRGRLLEARYEAELALRFLEEGLYRNAAGKAFQAWKALLAALAVDYVEVLAERFRGVRSTREGRRVRLADFIAAFMPTGYMLAVASVLEKAAGVALVDLTNVALNLHEFQYNGLDRAGVFSRYPSLEFVEEDVRRLAGAVLELAARLGAG